MNKKRVFLTVISCLLILGIGIGVKMHMDDVEEQKQEVKRAEELIAKDVIKHYEGINEIKFKKIYFNSSTGVYQFQFEINKEHNIFSYDFYNIKDYQEVGVDENLIENFHDKYKNGLNNNEINNKIENTEIIELTKIEE